MASEERRKFRSFEKILSVLLTVTIFLNCQPAIGRPIRITRPSFSDRLIRPSFSDRLIRPSFSDRLTRPSLSDKLTRPSLSDRLTRPSFRYKGRSPIPRKLKIQLTQKKVQKHAKNSAVNYLKSEANDKSFNAVHKVALEAARKNNQYKYKISEVDLNSIAVIATVLALISYEESERAEK